MLHFSELVRNNICYKEEIKNTDRYTYICQRGNFDKSNFRKIRFVSIDLHKEFILDLSKLFYDVGDNSYFMILVKPDDETPDSEGMKYHYTFDGFFLHILHHIHKILHNLPNLLPNFLH